MKTINQTYPIKTYRLHETQPRSFTQTVYYLLIHLQNDDALASSAKR